MKRITRIAALAMALVLCFALAACGSSTPAKELTAEDYANLIRDSRAAEDNESLEIIAGSQDKEPSYVHNPYDIQGEMAKDNITLMLDMMSIDPANYEKFAFSTSMMNTLAYHIGIYKPAEGKQDAAKTELDAYVLQMQKTFEHYLPEPYEIAKAAIVKTLPGGEIIVVMAEDAAGIAEKLEAAL